MRLSSAVVLASSFLLSACALYPVPEDVARLNTAQIVQQIRCEVRQALKKHAFRGGHAPFSEQDVDKEVNAARRAARLKAVFEHISRIREKNIEMVHNEAYLRTRNITRVGTTEEYDKIIKLTSENARIQCDLENVPGCGAERTPSLNTKIRNFIKDTYVQSQCIIEEFEGMDSLLRRVVNELSDKEAEAKKKTYKKAISEGKFAEEAEELSEQAAIRTAIQLAGLRHVGDRRGTIIQAIECFRHKNRYYQDPLPKQRLWQAACRDQTWTKQCRFGVNLQSGGEDKPQSGEDDLNKKRLEQRIKLIEAGLDNGFKNVALGYGFEFRMTDKDTSSIGLDFSLPFSNGLFSLGTTLSEDKTRANTRTFDLTEEVGHLMADTATCDVRSADWRYPLTGEIGLEETVKTYVKLASIGGFFSTERKKSEPKKGDGGTQSKGESSKATEFTDALEFTTEIAGGLSPVLSLNAVPNQFRLVKATPKISGSRKDVHKLTITFVKGDTEQTDVPADTLYPEGFDPPLSDTVDCVRGQCTSGSGAVLNFRPQIPNLKGTIRCINKVCTIEAPVGTSPTDKALESLKEKRNQDAIRKTIREELDTQ